MKDDLGTLRDILEALDKIQQPAEVVQLSRPRSSSRCGRSTTCRS